MKTDELTPVEAAKTLGVGRLYIYELLASGLLRGRKVLDRWLISRQEIERYRQEHPRVGSRAGQREARNG
jgi:excisionase family DNA binding protein